MAKMDRMPALICCGVLLAVILALVVVFVALYFTMFRPRSPHVVATVVSSKISFIKPYPPALNLTFDVEVTVDNPNYASFRYGEVVTEVRYHGLAVGQSVVPAGGIGARTTETVGATVEVDAMKVVFTPYFFPQAMVGVLPFSTTTTVAGKAVVLGKFKIRASSVVTCNITVYPARQESTPQCASTVHVG